MHKEKDSGETDEEQCNEAICSKLEQLPLYQYITNNNIEYSNIQNRICGRAQFIIALIPPV